jgi:hypothetical protein
MYQCSCLTYLIVMIVSSMWEPWWGSPCFRNILLPCATKVLLKSMQYPVLMLCSTTIEFLDCSRHMYQEPHRLQQYLCVAEGIRIHGPPCRTNQLKSDQTQDILTEMVVSTSARPDILWLTCYTTRKLDQSEQALDSTH